MKREGRIYRDDRRAVMRRMARLTPAARPKDRMRSPRRTPVVAA
jgi:hypothetical protein